MKAERLLIEHVETRQYAHDFGRRIGDANGVFATSTIRSSVVFVHCEGGIVGVGLGGGDTTALGEHLVGRDARSVVDLVMRLRRSVFKTGYEGASRAAIGALDVALWDAASKHYDVPLWRLLGGGVGKVEAYGSALGFGLSDDELGEIYSRFAAAGVRGVKVKVDRDIDSAIRRIRLVKDVMSTRGVPPMLMIDANESWTPKQAISVVAAIEREFELLWVEEPVGRRDAHGLRQVSDGITASVASGENLTSVHDFVPLLNAGAPDVVQVGGPTGITGYLQVAALADAYSRPISSVGSHWALAHAATTAPTQSMVEVSEISAIPPVNFGCEIRNGYVVLSDRPGTGVEVDLATIDDLELPSLPGISTPHYRRADAGRIGSPQLREDPQ